jgi:hypothetical protein
MLTKAGYEVWAHVREVTGGGDLPTLGLRVRLRAREKREGML